MKNFHFWKFFFENFWKFFFESFEKNFASATAAAHRHDTAKLFLSYLHSWVVNPFLNLPGPQIKQRYWNNFEDKIFWQKFSNLPIVDIELKKRVAKQKYWVLWSAFIFKILRLEKFDHVLPFLYGLTWKRGRFKISY